MSSKSKLGNLQNACFDSRGGMNTALCQNISAVPRPAVCFANIVRISTNVRSAEADFIEVRLYGALVLQ